MKYTKIEDAIERLKWVCSKVSDEWAEYVWQLIVLWENHQDCLHEIGHSLKLELLRNAEYSHTEDLAEYLEEDEQEKTPEELLVGLCLARDPSHPDHVKSHEEVVSWWRKHPKSKENKK